MSPQETKEIVERLVLTELNSTEHQYTTPTTSEEASSSASFETTAIVTWRRSLSPTSTTDGALNYSLSNQQSSKPSGIDSSTSERHKSSIVVEQQESGREGSLHIDLGE